MTAWARRTRQRFITLEKEKHKLVHVTVYATMEAPSQKKKQIFHLHTTCGAKARRGEFKDLGDRSKRVPSCIRCIRWPYPQTHVAHVDH